MSDKKTSDKIMEATIELLKRTKDTSKITARLIAKTAEVNLAMINYCYRSKDELIAIAVDCIISENIKKLLHKFQNNGSAEQQLRELLYIISDELYKFKHITKISLPYMLLQEEIRVPYQILPLVRKCLGETKNEWEYKLYAYQLISMFQIIFLQEDNFKVYLDFDISKKEDRYRLIDWQITEMCHFA